MRSRSIGIVLGFSTILLGSMVYAQCCNWGWDGSYNPSAKPENISTFQKDSASLRDELAVKQQELAKEMNRADYDPNRAATIKKEIIDIEAKLEALARKNNVYSGCGCNSQYHDGASHSGTATMRGGCNCGNW